MPIPASSTSGGPSPSRTWCSPDGTPASVPHARARRAPTPRADAAPACAARRAPVPRGTMRRMRVFVTGLGGYLGHALAAAAPGPVAGTVRERPAPPGARPFRIDVRDEAAVAAALAAARRRRGDPHRLRAGGRGLARRSTSTARRPWRGPPARTGRGSIHVSSDAIFPGASRPVDRGRPAAPAQRRTRATKADAEPAVAAAHPGAVLVRTSLIYGGAALSNHERRALDPAAELLRRRDPLPDRRRRPRRRPPRAGRACPPSAARSTSPAPTPSAASPSRARRRRARTRPGGGPRHAEPARAARATSGSTAAARAGSCGRRLRGVREVLRG